VDPLRIVKGTGEPMAGRVLCGGALPLVEAPIADQSVLGPSERGVFGLPDLLWCSSTVPQPNLFLYLCTFRDGYATKRS